MSEKKILVTGALGYLGSQLVARLAQEKTTNHEIAEIIAADIRKPAQEMPGVRYIQLDIRDENLGEILQQHQITTVVHLAAIVTPGKKSDREFEYSVDVLGTKNILEACVKAQVSRIIVSSSGAAYGYHADNPEWISEEQELRGNYEFAYSHHKKLVEEMLAQYREQHPQLQQTIFRVCTILGETTDNQITSLFMKKRILTLKGANTPFVFIWDQDMVGCLFQAIFSEKTGIFNVAGDGAVTLPEIADMLGKKCRVLSPTLVKLALGILKPLGISRYGPEQIKFLQYRPVLLNTKLKQEFGYIPQKNSRQVFEFFIEKRFAH